MSNEEIAIRLIENGKCGSFGENDLDRYLKVLQELESYNCRAEEKDKEIERLQKDLTYYQKYSADLLSKNNTFESIIEEVREYIEGLYDVRFTDKDKRNILGILDKVEE